MRIRSLRDLTTVMSRQLGLFGVVVLAALLCDLVIVVASSSDGLGATGQELWLLPGLVALAWCAWWAPRDPWRAGWTASAVLSLSTAWQWLTGTMSYTALLDKITFTETAVGVGLVYLAVSTLRPLAAFTVTSVLVCAALSNSAVRMGAWGMGLSPSTVLLGAVLLAVTVFVAVLQRDSRPDEGSVASLLRRQWLIVGALAASLFLETFYSGTGNVAGLITTMCSVGTSGAALLAGRAPARAAAYFSVLTVLCAVITKVVSGSTGYANLVMPLSQVLGGMVIVVAVVRNLRPLRAAGLITMQSAAVALTVLLDNWRNSGYVRSSSVAALLVLGICVAVGMFLRARDSERHQAVATAVSDAQTAERMALARELHDVVAHHVTGIVVQAQAAGMLAQQNPAVVVDALAQIEKAGTDAMTAMRRLVRSMRGDAPAGASEFSEQATSDLAADLRRLVDTGSHGVPTRLHLDVPPDLPPEVARSALRLVQESLTNVGKHARQATGVDVTVDVVRGELHIRVLDDGATGDSGPPGASRTRLDRPVEDSGYGLIGMRERVDLLRGRLVSGPSAGGGWLVEAWLPLTSEGRKDGE